MADSEISVTLGAAFLSGLAALAVTLLSIRAGRKERIADRVEARKLPFRERQLDILLQALRTASTLATCTERSTWRKTSEQFWHLYLGEMAVVENAEVEGQMVLFGTALKDLGVDPDLPAVNLRGQTISLAYAIREMIAESWNVELPELSAQYAQLAKTGN